MPGERGMEEEGKDVIKEKERENGRN